VLIRNRHCVVLLLNNSKRMYVETMKLDKAFECNCYWILLRKEFQIAMLGAGCVQCLIPNKQMEQADILFFNNQFCNRF